MVRLKPEVFAGRMPEPALGWPAAAGGAGPRAGPGARHPAAGRAAGRHRPQAAEGDAAGAQGANKQLGTTFIYVTHDQEEALTMSDRIAVMDNARVAQLGTPAEIYENPRTAFVAKFIGESNFFEGQVDGPRGPANGWSGGMRRIFPGAPSSHVSGGEAGPHRGPARVDGRLPAGRRSRRARTRWRAPSGTSSIWARRCT